MTARKWAAWVLLTALCLFLDTAALRFIAFEGIRPSLLLGFALASASVFSVQSGMVIAAVGGFLIDAITGTTLGLTPACYVAAVLVCYAFRTLPDKPAGARYLKFLPGAFFAPAALFLLSLLLGTRAPVGRTLLFLTLPCALLTAAVALLFELWLRGMRKGQVTRT